MSSLKKIHQLNTDITPTRLQRCVHGEWTDWQTKDIMPPSTTRRQRHNSANSKQMYFVSYLTIINTVLHIKTTTNSTTTTIPNSYLSNFQSVLMWNTAFLWLKTIFEALSCFWHSLKKCLSLGSSKLMRKYIYGHVCLCIFKYQKQCLYLGKHNCR